MQLRRGIADAVVALFKAGRRREAKNTRGLREGRRACEERRAAFVGDVLCGELEGEAAARSFPRKIDSAEPRELHCHLAKPGSFRSWRGGITNALHVIGHCNYHSTGQSNPAGSKMR